MLNLRENLSPHPANIVLENAHEGKDLYMKGICIQGGVRNANHVCIVNEIGRAVKSTNKLQEDIRSSRSWIIQKV